MLNSMKFWLGIEDPFLHSLGGLRNTHSSLQKIGWGDIFMMSLDEHRLIHPFLQRRDGRGFPRDSPWAKPEGNPKENPLYSD